jgi:hypothetical protein
MAKPRKKQIALYALGFTPKPLKAHSAVWMESTPQVSLHEPFQINWDPKEVHFSRARIDGFELRFSAGRALWMPTVIRAGMKVELYFENLSAYDIPLFAAMISGASSVSIT